MPCFAESNVNLVQADAMPWLVPAPTSDGEPTKYEKVKPVPTSGAESRPARRRLAVDPADFVCFQLSCVPEVERVYVDKDQQSLDVLIVVNARDVKLRKQIYACEKIIIDGFPDCDFDFDILARVNHDLSEILTESQPPAYVRTNVTR